MMKIFRRLTATLALVGFSAVAVAGSGYNYLDVQLVTQQHSEWCWAASSTDVVRWYGMSAEQCYIVNWAYGRNDACGSNVFNWNSSANSPNSLYGSNGSVASILNNAGINTYAYQSALNWNAVVNNIDAGHPFVMRFGWYGGGGHILVGYGYYDTQGTPMIGYMNPWPGEGYTWSNYNWTVYASYDHTWTHTLTTSK